MYLRNISSIAVLSLITTPMAAQPVEALAPREAMSSARAARREMAARLSLPPRFLPMGQYVGELQERWQFPSDHLPIGLSYDDLHIGSWNVLDSEYMSWVIENSQGLSRSQIADEHIYLDGTKLTKRDTHVADIVVEMLTHPTHPKSLLALQECNPAFIDHLKQKLPANFRIVSHHGDSVVVDENVFELIDAKAIDGIFSASKKRTIQEIVVRRKENGEALKLINVHLPGDPLGPARFELTQYLNKSYDPKLPSIALGDMNFNELEMREACNEWLEGFRLLSPYCTNVSVAKSEEPFTSKAIDHFIVNSPKNVSMLNADEVWLGLNETYRLLN